MSASKQMTPERAGQLYGWCIWASGGALVVSIVASFFNDGVSWAAFAVSVIAGVLGLKYVGWVDGWRAHERRTASARLQVLRLPMVNVAGALEEPFALVMDNAPSLTPVQADAVSKAVDAFAKNCGGRAGMAVSIRLDLEDPLFLSEEDVKQQAGGVDD